jgi:hypothetical protein
MATEPAATSTQDKKAVSWSSVFLWPSVILVVYVLSIGPIMMLVGKGVIAYNKGVADFYSPLEYAYGQTPLHKPLGIYLHLWRPERFDKNGDIGLFLVKP